MPEDPHQIFDWTIIRTGKIMAEVQRVGLSTWVASEGDQWIELDGDETGPGVGWNKTAEGRAEQGLYTIQQDVSSLTPGKTYSLSFDFAARPGTKRTENQLRYRVLDAADTSQVVVGGDLIAEVTQVVAKSTPPRWRTATEFFVAPASGQVRIEFTGLGPNNTFGMFLDNVVVVPVVLDLDVDSDNDGTIEHSDVEEAIEDEWLGRLVPVAVPTESEKPSATLEVKIGGIPINANAVRFTGDPSLFRLWRRDPKGAWPEDQIFFGEGFVYSASALGMTAGAWRTFYVEALDTRTGSIGIEVDTSGDGQWTVMDSALLTGIQVDLDTDSNDDGGIDSDNTWAGTDDPFEAFDPVVVLANTGDDDDDGVPNFAEGFALDADLAAQLAAAGLSAGEASTTSFEPFVLTIPNATDLGEYVEVTFSYSASDPLEMELNGTKVVPKAGQGRFRLWTKDGSESRDGRDVMAGGNFVPANEPISLGQLGLGGGVNSVVLFLEATGASSDEGDPISVKVGKAGASSSETAPTAKDATRAKSLQSGLVFSTIRDKGDGAPFNEADGDLDADKTPYLPLNSDDDDNDGEVDGNDTDKPTDAENDLLPFRIVPKPGDPVPVSYQLGFENAELRVWRNTPDGVKRVFPNTTIKPEANGAEVPLLLEARGDSATVAKLTLKQKLDAKGDFRVVEKREVRSFLVSGPRNVPGYAKYEYVATGGGDANDSSFISPSVGEEVEAFASNQADKQTVLWGAGGEFGKIRYKPSADYVWAFDVAVVLVDINTDPLVSKLTPGTASPVQNAQQPNRIDTTRYHQTGDTPEPAIVMSATIRQVVGPERLVSGNKVMFGVRDIEVGWSQTLKFTKYAYHYDNEDLVNVVGRSGVGELQGKVFSDAITVAWKPGVTYDEFWDLERWLDGASPVDLVRKVDFELPWYDKTGETAAQVGDVVTMPFKDFVADAKQEEFVLRAIDVPQGNGLRFEDWDPTKTPGGYEMVFDFTSYLIVRTKDTENGADGIYTMRMKGDWQFDGTGTYVGAGPGDFGVYDPIGGGVTVVTPLGEVKNGSRLVPTTLLANAVLP